MPITLERPEGNVTIEELSDGRRSLSVVPAYKDQFIFCSNWTTFYPMELIEHMFQIHGAPGLCFEIMRDEDPEFVQKFLKNDLFAYFSQEDFSGKRILDFGCGTGASTILLSKMFPEAEFIGVELIPAALSVARKRLEYYKFSNITFLQSPGGSELPDDMGKFDFVILSAVYEHLFRFEREILLPKLWNLINDGGYLFINQTPNIIFPFELHTTMLPFINYVPDSIALQMAHRFSKRIEPNETWEELLRKGIRGASEGEILRILNKTNARAEMLEPKNNGLKDRIDLYYLNTNSQRLRTLKNISKIFLKAIRAVSGVTLVPDLSLAFRKPARKTV